MPLFTLVPTLHKAMKTPEWKSVPQFKSKGRQLTHEGVVYEVFNKKQKFNSIFLRIALIATTFLLLGILLISKSIRKIILKGKETIRFAVPVTALQPPVARHTNKLLSHLADKHTTLVPLYREIDRIREEDQISPPNSWKRGLGAQEIEQPLEHFNWGSHPYLYAARRTANIVILGNQTENEKSLLPIIGAYLFAVHGVNIKLINASMELNPQLQRVRDGSVQYSTHSQCAALQEVTDAASFSLGFTNQDLYPSQCPNVNFLFGEGEIICGVFSSKRLSGEGLKKTLVRLMKLASHEFAHMRGLDHCIHYKCAIQGINNVLELDRSSLIFCAQDMAKISLINNCSIRKLYRSQLAFFENFFKKFNLKIDFSKEIQLLKNKIHKL